MATAGSTNTAGEGRPLPTTMHSETSSPQVAWIFSSIALNAMSVKLNSYGRRHYILCLTTQTVLALYPVIIPATEEAASSLHLVEQIASIEMAIRAAKG